MLRKNKRYRIMFIELRHLNIETRTMLERGVIFFYDICYNEVYWRFRKMYEQLVPLGYSLVLRRGKQRLLLKYNKRSERNKNIFIITRGHYKIITTARVPAWGNNIYKRMLIGFE